MKFGFTLLSLILVILLISPLPLMSDMFDTKTVGKLSMVLILSSVAVTVKLLMHKDQKDLKLIHDKYGKPSSFLEFRDGFDLMRVEFYDDQVFIYRNGRLIKTEAKDGQFTKGQCECLSDRMGFGEIMR